MTSALRLAVFDVDGTLVDSQHNIATAMATAFATHGLAQASPRAVRRVIGLSLVEAVAVLLPGLPHDDHVRVANSYKEAFFDLRQRPNHDEPLFGGAEAALSDLERAGWLLGIATGKSQRGVRAMLDRHGLHGRFLTIQTADENPGKPHPAMLLAAMAELGVGAANAVMIGDTAYDMLMAKNAQTAAVGVAWGYHAPEELHDCGARAVVDEFVALPALLETIIEEHGCVLAPS